MSHLAVVLPRPRHGTTNPSGRRPLPAMLVLLAAVVLALAALAATHTRELQPSAAPPEMRGASSVDTQAAAHRYGSVPLAFVPNRGQMDRRVRYQAQAGDTAMFFGDRKVTFAFGASRAGAGLNAPMPGAHGAGTFQRLAAQRNLALDLRFVGADPHARPRAFGSSATTVNYLRGTDHSRWRQRIPTAAGVTYPGLWNGVDMRLAGTGTHLKYEFTVAPGAAASAIGLSYAGANGVSLGRDGSLRVHTARGVLKDAAPVAFQRIHGRRVPVASRFTLRGKSGYGFSVGAYDHTRPLVIDPSIGYATFLGGPSAYETATSVKVDSAGNAYVVGTTSGGTDFPTTTGAYDTTSSGNDIFVSKLAPGGNSLVYSTFIGVSGEYSAEDLAVGDDGAAYVVGYAGGGIPTTAGAPQRTFSGGPADAFAAKLSANGGSLLYATYLGSSQFDEAEGVAVDAAGHAYVTGYTAGGTPTTAGAYDTTLDGNDVFLTKLAADGKSLVYSTYLGGDGSDSAYAVAVDGSGSADVTGTTTGVASGFPPFPTTTGAFQTAHDADNNGDAFVTKFAPDGKSLAYSTLLGGTRGDFGFGIAVDGAGSAYVGGVTGGGVDTVGHEFPTTAGAFDTTHNSSADDGFVTKLAADGKSLVYSTIVGGGTGASSGGADAVTDLAIDGAGHAYVTGYTTSTDFPVTSDAVQKNRSTSSTDVNDSFATELAPDGKTLAFSTYFGAGAAQAGGAANGIDVSSQGRIFIAGADNGRMTATTGAYDTSGAGNPDAFVARFDPSPTTSAPQCSDGTDNDSDGRTDYPADPGCSSATDTSESPDPAAPAAQCADGTDNDSDGKTDYPADPGCTSATDTSESPDPFVPPGITNPAPTPPQSGSSQPPSSIDTVKPALGGLSFGSSRFRAATSGASASAKRKAKAGTKVSFSLSEAASVRFTVERKVPGRKVGRTCKTATRANRRKKACTVWKAVRGSFAVAGKPGVNRFTFSGRVGGKALRPGAYRLSATATDPSRNASLPSRRAFAIIK